VNHVPRKRFGQHFLHDAAVINRILDAIAPQPDDHIVEIGPGLGALTFPLLTRITSADAIEIDRDAIRDLRSKTTDQTLRIHEGDVLKFEFGKLRHDARPLRLIGNLPYNISTPLLFQLIAQREHIRDMHFMLQKEVVDRMAAQPNTEAYGRLTVMLAPWMQVESLFDVGRGAFRPPPKVTSSIVRLIPHTTPPFAIADHDVFARIVSAAFSQRRKTLRNAIKTLMPAEAIVKAGIDPGVRGETLSPAQFATLASHCTSAQRNG
jgi:16S rRNA (adenine1518-N6/adenine1519-N6)-dimethyltransferase